MNPASYFGVAMSASGIALYCCPWAHQEFGSGDCALVLVSGISILVLSHLAE